MKTITSLLIGLLALSSFKTYAQKPPTEGNLPYVYLHQILGNESDSSLCQINAIPFPENSTYNIICTVFELTADSNKPSYVNLFFTTKKDTFIYNIHHTTNLSIPAGNYTVFIQRKGMGYVHKQLKIKSKTAYGITLKLKPRPVIMDVKYACATKSDLKKLIKVLDSPEKKVEENCNCVNSGVIFYD